MRFLERERATLEKLLPGLDESLREIPLMQLENPKDTYSIRTSHQKDGPILLVPKAQEGIGATAVDALRVQRALGSRSPSLAVATTTHHFSIGTLIGLIPPDDTGDGFASGVLGGAGYEGWLVASSFAEERLDAGILSSSMTATEGYDGVRISGVTRPYGLAWVMDMLIADVMVSRMDGQGEERALVLVDAQSEGVSGTSASGEAQNGQVTFDNVLVDNLTWASDFDKPVDVLLTRASPGSSC
ncbi:hypothetical protein ABZ897_40965 [Nonomuraea sp. NPDC046802]|uniref:hypothetical protein n=1 Tax=Nonomuraea sp. NPDC046802 TaxID=3154919 RepID=UPI003406BA3F